MTKPELEVMKMVVDALGELRNENIDAHNILQEDIKGMIKELSTVTTTVYGNEGDNGLVGDYKDVRKLNRRNFYLIMGIVAVVASLNTDKVDWSSITRFVMGV